jgi:DNA repair exonuclease SbcCD ATPase subunit
MPKAAMDYSKTNIYKIVCNDLTVKDCYVGHTINMTKRKCNHKSVCNNENYKAYNLKIYQIIRENGGWDNWSMLLVEKFPCKDKYEACKREREVYEELEAKMNTFIPYLTQEERKEYLKQYLKQYREEHKEYHKQYYQEHKEEHKEKLKEKAECEYCSKRLTKCHMSRHHKTCKSK